MSQQNQQNIQTNGSKNSNGFEYSDEDILEKKKIGTEVKKREDLMTDICNVLVHCERHQKICVSEVVSKGLWLPSIRIRYKISSTLTANELLKEIGLGMDEFMTSGGQLINIFRTQLIQSANFVTRLTFLVRISEDNKDL